MRQGERGIDGERERAVGMEEKRARERWEWEEKARCKMERARKDREGREGRIQRVT